MCSSYRFMGIWEPGGNLCRSALLCFPWTLFFVLYLVKKKKGDNVRCSSFFVMYFPFSFSLFSRLFFRLAWSLYLVNSVNFSPCGALQTRPVISDNFIIVSFLLHRRTTTRAEPLPHHSTPALTDCLLILIYLPISDLTTVFWTPTTIYIHSYR